MQLTKLFTKRIKTESSYNVSTTDKTLKSPEQNNNKNQQSLKEMLIAH